MSADRTSLVSQYLDRIEYTGPLEPTAEVLKALHRSHMMTVPFENLDIHLGRRIVLDESQIVQKLVTQRRGGFCYELNGAFAFLLRELGYRVQLLSAGVAKPDGQFDPFFDHLALAVSLGERMLADVGFGDSFLEPLLLDSREEQIRGLDAYRLSDWEIDEDILRQVGQGSRLDGEKNGEPSDDSSRSQRVIVLERCGPNGEWKPEYRFLPVAFGLSDFQPMCDYHQTSPESIFTRKRTCTRATPHGRVTVSGMRLIETNSGDRTETDITGTQHYDQIMQDRFGIRFSPTEIERLVSFEPTTAQ
ncbi:MAG TPA: arylamine N-acetyltransferase [Blastocatellia bacterium]|nr:arylamine N-acetyltransferase [Blastocatellia bacterium]